MANRYNIEINQGATFTVTATWKDYSGTPINLTGYTARMQIRDSYASATAIVSLTSSAGIVLGGSAGTVTVTISATDTAALSAPWSGVYDLELVDNTGVVTRLLEGVATVSPEVTR